MKVTFRYDLEKDLWCLLNYGKPKINQGQETPQYKQLLEHLDGNDNESSAREFVKKYISSDDITTRIEECSLAWSKVEKEFHQRAEKIWGLELKEDVTCYFTINRRCPYDISSNLFFQSFSSYSKVRTAMHELWHFYTWHAFGGQQEVDRIGSSKYHEIKESMTVLLNIVCKDLMEEGVQDNGYPQHALLRGQIVEMWGNGKSAKEIWATLT